MTGNNNTHNNLRQEPPTIPSFTRMLSAVPMRSASRTWDAVLTCMIVPRLESCSVAAYRLIPQLSTLTRWATTLIVYHIDAVVYEDPFVCVRINLCYDGRSAPDQLDSQFLAAIEPLEPDSRIRITFLCKNVDLIETLTVPALHNDDITVELRSTPGHAGYESDESPQLPFEKDPAESLSLNDNPSTVATMIEDAPALDSLGNQTDDSTPNVEPIHE